MKINKVINYYNLLFIDESFSWKFLRVTVLLDTKILNYLGLLDYQGILQLLDSYKFVHYHKQLDNYVFIIILFIIDSKRHYF